MRCLWSGQSDQESWRHWLAPSNPKSSQYYASSACVGGDDTKVKIRSSNPHPPIHSTYLSEVPVPKIRPSGWNWEQVRARERESIVNLMTLGQRPARVELTTWRWGVVALSDDTSRANIRESPVLQKEDRNHITKYSILDVQRER